ncbi:hypothetical protein GVAV_001427 [Gurleya vavrai]
MKNIEKNFNITENFVFDQEMQLNYFFEHLFYNNEKNENINDLLKISQNENLNNLKTVIFIMQHVSRILNASQHKSAILRLKILHEYFNNNLIDIECINPFDYKVILSGINIKKTVIHNSYNFPIEYYFYKKNFVTFVDEINNENEYVRMLFKCNDDLTKDLFVQKLIVFFEEIFKKPIQKYKVIPLNRFEGLVEIINNLKKPFLSLSNLNYFLKDNFVSKNFIDSLGMWICIGYVLGIGDRNIKNILIKEDGSIFYIDFSYLFGDDPAIKNKNFNLPALICEIIIEILEEITKRVIENIFAIRKNFENVLIFVEKLLLNPMYMIETDQIKSFMLNRLMINTNSEIASLIIENGFLNELKNFETGIFSKINSIGRFLRL